jgi:hypothetical protein
MHVYTNKELAFNYLNVALQLVAPSKKDLERFDERYDLIAHAPTDISEFYAQNRSLRSLPIKVGNPAKRILESILESGVEEARKIVFEKRHGEVRAKEWPGANRVEESRDNDPSWDNAIRLSEE